MKGRIIDISKNYYEGSINSYSQIFFSDNKRFAWLLLLASFVDPFAGLSGLLAVLISILFSRWFGFNPALTRNGTYGYNSLMMGMVMGIFYQFNPEFFLFLVLVSVLTLLITVSVSALTSRHGIPFLSIPFMIGIWLVILSARNYGALHLSERGIYTYNELWSWGGPRLVKFYNDINTIPIPRFIEVYLKSLGAILFQYNIISGVLIAVGLLFCSRIAFSLSLLGFSTGYLFYYLIQGNFTELQYSYIGFNFILTAIALGGFFLVPSFRSYLLVVVCTPLTGILISALGGLLSIYQLPLYSLPFNFLVMLILYVLNLRAVPKRPDLVSVQLYSPEKNLYLHHYRMERYKNETYFHINLPFFGEWFVSQGIDGKITHKDDWKYAWDFVVVDEMSKTFRLPGTSTTDFYCYNLPVLSPAGGYVIALNDDVEDNEIGNVDLQHNWGNTIVIKHADLLFTKISHIKKGSFRVKIGDYVSKGDIIANCGNSGRSPEPHIHFQIQATPSIGSKTLQYPLSYYISRDLDKYSFHSFEYPDEGEYVSRVATTKLIREAFNFIPGETMQFKVTGMKGGDQELKWEIYSDAYNRAYIYCPTTKSSAYFTNNETLHYFTDFYGDQNSLLFHFYSGAHKIILGYYGGMDVSDVLPVHNYFGGVIRFFHDFIAPFHIFLRAKFNAVHTSIDDIANPQQITLKSSAESFSGNRVLEKREFDFVLKKGRIEKITITGKNQKIVAECID